MQSMLPCRICIHLGKSLKSTSLPGRPPWPLVVEDATSGFTRAIFIGKCINWGSQNEDDLGVPRADAILDPFTQTVLVDTALCERNHSLGVCLRDPAVWNEPRWHPAS